MSSTLQILLITTFENNLFLFLTESMLYSCIRLVIKHTIVLTVLMSFNLTVRGYVLIIALIHQ